MFDFLKTKAKINLVLDADTAVMGGKISGKVIISPTSDFTSNTLKLYIIPEDLSFSCEIPFHTEHTIQGQSDFMSGLEYVVPFEINCTSLEEMRAWFNIYEADMRMNNTGDNYSILREKLGSFEVFLSSAVSGDWSVSAHFDIPGFDVSDKKNIRVQYVSQPSVE